jgi:hypothetical protein
LNGYSGAQYALLEWLDGCWQVELHAIKYDTARIRSDFLRKSLLEEGGPLARCSLNSIESGEDSSLNLLRYAWRLAKQVGRQAGRQADYQDIACILDQIQEKAEDSYDWDLFQPK